MKTAADRLNTAVLAVKDERWEYLVALGAVVLLTVLCLYSILSNSYYLTSVVITSHNDMSNIATYHEALIQRPIVPITHNVAPLPLFGTAPIVTTNSHFTLLGIEYSNHGRSPAKAIISSDDSNGNSDIYRVGDKLPQGAMVNDIGTDHVVLLYNGSLEKIYLQWEMGTGKDHD